MPATFSPVPVWARVTLASFGALSFTLGTVAVFVTENGSGSAVLITLGGVLFALMLLWDRVDSLELGGTKLRLRAAAAERFADAEQSEKEGRATEAQLIRAEAQSMMAAAGALAADFRQVRSSMAPGPERTRETDRIVRRMRTVAAKESLGRAEVVDWLATGNEEQRISALAVMEVRPDLRDVGVVLSTFHKLNSYFEQHHGLLVLLAAIDDIDHGGRERIRRFLETYEPRVGTTSRRRMIFDEIRRRLSRTETPTPLSGERREDAEPSLSEPVAPTDRES